MIEKPSGRNGHDGSWYLALRGVGRSGEGEMLRLHVGESVVCGRSRHCDWSLKRTPHYLTISQEDRAVLRGTLGWRSTSRRHCRITYVAPDMVDVENLSQNGTLVDGRSVDRVLLTDCQHATHRVQLGPYGVVLELEPGALPVDLVARERDASDAE
jgi:pSer/pThr/pTyr-binding forkhead associated (FHA) protein